MCTELTSDVPNFRPNQANNIGYSDAYTKILLKSKLLIINLIWAALFEARNDDDTTQFRTRRLTFILLFFYYYYFLWAAARAEYPKQKATIHGKLNKIKIAHGNDTPKTTTTKSFCANVRRGK